MCENIEITLTIKGEITRMRLQPGDKVVVSFDHNPSRDVREHVAEEVKSIFPDHQVILLAEGMALSIAGSREVEGEIS